MSNDTSTVAVTVTAPAAKAHPHRPTAAGSPSRASMREGGTLPEVERLGPNVLGVRHWSRLLGGLLYATSPRLSWPQLLRRTFEVDILRCAKCSGPVQFLSAIVDMRDARRILERLGIPSDIPPIARARDPTHLDEDEDEEQPRLRLAKRAASQADSLPVRRPPYDLLTLVRDSSANVKSHKRLCQRSPASGFIAIMP